MKQIPSIWFIITLAVLAACSEDDKPPPTASTPDIGGSVPELTVEERRVAEAQGKINSLGWESLRVVDTNPAPLAVSPTLLLDVAYGDSIFYRLTGEFGGTLREYMIRPLSNNTFLTENRFFRLDGQTKSLSFVSRNPNVVEVAESGALTFRSEGATSVAVGVDSTYIDIPIRVEIIDLRQYQSMSAVVESWGLADQTAGVVLDWLDSTTLNEKPYYNDEAGEDLYVEQWFYARLPRGFLEFRGSSSNSKTLFRVRTQHWENIIFSPVYPQFYINL